MNVLSEIEIISDIEKLAKRIIELTQTVNILLDRIKLLEDKVYKLEG